jgi:predicted glutamine amidotransferase
LDDVAHEKCAAKIPFSFEGPFKNIPPAEEAGLIFSRANFYFRIRPAVTKQVNFHILMCRMMSKISVKETSILDEMLMCPYSLEYLSENGRQPSDPRIRGRHRDGSGMAFAKNGGVEVHKRSKENAWDASYRETARNAASNIFIAHNRLASKGLEVTQQGAHPFMVTAAGKSFALCHNGGVRSYMEEAKRIGTSDSFIFLRALIDPAGKNDVDSIFQRLEVIARTTEYTSLCSFMITPEELYVWRIYSRQNEEKIEVYEKYYTLYMSMRGNSALFSSEPLDDLPWMLLENNTFLHLRINENAVSVDYRSLQEYLF